MKNNKFFPAILLIVTMLCFGGLSGLAQQVPQKMVEAFQKGDADALAPHFNERFQLTLLGVDHRVSQSQAKEMMREFFKNNPPVSFEIMFKGDKKDSNFAVGKLVTKTQTFRVNLFFKKVDEQNLLHLLEIEKDNGGSF
ncbi:MAG: DUF4783 domain-containing protein [Bacteroidales bacterium]|nr:DUF4783 domain-containing protein [Bacteroidales bacterium]